VSAKFSVGLPRSSMLTSTGVGGCDPVRVIVAGSGVAALETCLALRAFAGDRVHVTLIAPEPYFVHRPTGEHDPLSVRGLERVPMTRVARAAGADPRLDRLAAVDPAARRVLTAQGDELAYDAVVLAIGAVPLEVPEGAQPFDAGHAAGCRSLLRRLRAGDLESLAFVEPPGPTHAFDLYDLALEAAVSLRREHVDAVLTLVTAEPGPLAILGQCASAMLATTLGGHGVRVFDSSYFRCVGPGRIDVAPPSRRISADRVIAAPRLAGPNLAHLDRDADGFLPVDTLGRVRGTRHVFAAGDCTSFPVKHPSLAAQQGDAVATAIAAEAGAGIEPVPFEPVLKGLLPSRLRWYVEAPLTGGHGDATRVSALPLWSPRLRFHARFLGPCLEGLTPAAHLAGRGSAREPELAGGRP
jgi:sulfide:quinone oxidoreductase